MGQAVGAESHGPPTCWGQCRGGGASNRSDEGPGLVTTLSPTVHSGPQFPQMHNDRTELMSLQVLRLRGSS